MAPPTSGRSCFRRWWTSRSRIAISGGFAYGSIPVGTCRTCNTATVLAELVQETGLDTADFRQAAAAYPRASLRRLGWLLDFVSADVDTDALADELRADDDRRPTVLLDPGGHRRGHGNLRWGVVENADAEADL